MAQKPDIFRGISSNRDRFGFYAEFQIIFGTGARKTLTNLLFLKLAEDMGEPFDYRTNEMGSSPNFLHCKKI